MPDSRLPPFYLQPLHTGSPTPLPRLAFPIPHCHPPADQPQTPIWRCSDRKALVNRLKQHDADRQHAGYPAELVYSSSSASQSTTSPTYITPSTPLPAQSAGSHASSTTTPPTLRFSSHFESGNLQHAYQIAPAEYDLQLQVDKHTTNVVQWFMFACSGWRSETAYKFNVVNLSKGDSLFNQGMQPMYYNSRHQQWQRIGYDIAYYRISNTKAYALTFTVELSNVRPEDVICLTYHVPYTYTMLQHDLHAIASDTEYSGYCQQTVLCKSIAGNDVPMLTVTDETTDTTGKRVIIITARIHPGETIASWVCRGVINSLLSNSAVAVNLRCCCILHIVPMLNVDGVILGTYRSNAYGVDLNRAWIEPSETLHPEIYGVHKLIQQYTSQRRQPYFYADLHGHSRLWNLFSYSMQLPTSTVDCRLYPQLLAHTDSKFCMQNSIWTVGKNKDTTARVALASQYSIERCYTIECSFGGYMQRYRYAADTNATGVSTDDQELHAYQFETVHYEQFGMSMLTALHQMVAGDSGALDRAQCALTEHDLLQQAAKLQLQLGSVDTADDAENVDTNKPHAAADTAKPSARPSTGGKLSTGTQKPSVASSAQPVSVRARLAHRLLDQQRKRATVA